MFNMNSGLEEGSGMLEVSSVCITADSLEYQIIS